MQKLTLLFVAVLLASTSFAKIWRVNNNAGVVADFTTFNAAATSTSVLVGDTIHIEPSNTVYTTGNITLSKRLVVIGTGYFLNPADATFPGNTGLQYTTQKTELQQFTIGAGAAGSKFIGVQISLLSINAAATALNIVFEKVAFINNPLYLQSLGGNNNLDGITFRKCFFSNCYIYLYDLPTTATNLVIENCVFYGTGAYAYLPTLTGAGNIFRNNSTYTSNQFIISNAYVANNIFSYNAQNTFTNCTLKNNLFAAAQTLPGTATGNQINVNMTNVYVGGTTGSIDSRVALKTGSPAIGTGVTISGYTPDCGAFGGPDPYKLSGIPPIPSIYSLTVPTSIPTGTATMNVTFSSRNNN